MNAEVRDNSTTQDPGKKASMGPRSDERGSVADLPARPYVLAASMGPRSDERGSRPVWTWRGIVRRASMGPRSDERGSVAWRAARITLAALLQWGRVRMNAEVGACGAS